jgi:hypothetical protein
VALDAPLATLLADSTNGAGRHVSLRVTVPSGTTSVALRARGVLAAAIDGRAVDTTRYRARRVEWTMSYWAVPDSGAIVDLTLRAGVKLELELVSRRPGLPMLEGVTIPPRPAAIVPIQYGDVTMVRRSFSF